MERQSPEVVRFLGWHGYDTPLTCGEGFDATGIPLECDYVWEDQTIVDRLTAGAADAVDIVSPDLKFVPRMVATGLCAEIDLELIPNHRDLLPLMAEQQGLRSSGKQYAVPFTWGAHPLVYRPDLVSEPPTSWLDVLRAEYRGKVVMVGDYGGNLAAWAPVVTGTPDPGHLTREELKETIDFLIKIKTEHACAFTTDYVEMVDIMGRGEAVISTLGWEPQIRWAADRGIELAMVYPQEGTSAYLDVYVIPRGAPHPELAHRLINDALSIPAQVRLATELEQGVVNAKAISALPEPLRARYAYDDPTGLRRIARFTPAPPVEDDGEHATLDTIKREWARFKTA